MNRTYLFVPGNRPERYAKALAAGADAVIIDLEDAVAPAEKTAARDALRAWLSPAHPVLVRINSADTAWFEDDLALAGLPGVAGVVLPKAEQAGDVARLVAQGAPAVLPLIESALGFHNALDLARQPGVERLLFGSIDFSVDLGLTEGVEELQYFRSQLVLVSRLAGIQPPVDGVTTTLDDAGRLADDTRRARRYGFGGKLCIHPRQVAPVNAAFAPSEAEAAWALRVLQAVENTDGAAVAVDGKMVDRPVVLQAQAIIEEVRRRTAS
ncbi:HpcH/HpaI aldolase/citrate lyase family protein [Noviherbaspirillum suwonense]|jgi:citrate lyase subunit beta/citryl-CoA lyase|uniref:Citrate lyase subunit beta / citryl-CoA lyase n=1 Tax=Noviherbaspirillum suwonense TaxID=1224511 RepID=A0ABY1Q576_9BURK|nr:CoA ester lyase [Noviherbaspirillum suwonense]SMP57830.1 citrate lyase subunit beta / citryl-CoA lyase [Noviherbaspirillum suwonense]